MAILMTQCLQHDFVARVAEGWPLPNRLHVGWAESQRLLGASPEDGPVTRFMAWAQARSPAALAILHLRDWHRQEDASQQAHLGLFGDHCLADSDGAAFVFPVVPGRGTVIDSPTLNDFDGTGLDAVLAPWAGRAARVGLTGVWTEAKITFLAYELRTRYPQWRLGVCSALTASSSQIRHAEALFQLERLLGVEVYDSLGDFADFLAGGSTRFAGVAPLRHGVRLDGPEPALATDEAELVQQLYRHCRSVECRVLTGGYSGNKVLLCTGLDLYGHEEQPHVIKLGRRGDIARERTAFERIRAVLGPAAPAVVDFVDFGALGAVKYAYASMGPGPSTTFQQLYREGLAQGEIRSILETVFAQRLGRFCRAATWERCDLLDYYGFAPRWAAGVGQAAAAVVASAPAGRREALATGAARLVRFYAEDLDRLPRHIPGECYQAYIHGDLNGANILIDSQGNVWLIDFFHAHRGHVLRDLIKLENDLLYLFTPLATAAEGEEALLLSQALAGLDSLGAAVPDASDLGVASPALVRAWETVRVLRSFYPAWLREDLDPLQYWIGALRYAAHTLSFDEASARQKQWALASAALFGAAISDRLLGRG